VLVEVDDKMIPAKLLNSPQYSWDWIERFKTIQNGKLGQRSQGGRKRSFDLMKA
jgi:hypothetical protein